MELLVSILGIAAAVLIIAWLTGLVIPRGHYACRSIELHQSPQQIWNIITDYSAQPKWHPDIETVEPMDGDGEWTQWRETRSRDVTNIVRVAESEPPRRIAWAFHEENGSMRGRWVARLEPRNGVTKLIIKQELILASPWSRVIGVIVRRSSSLIQYLGALATYLDEPQSPKRE